MKSNKVLIIIAVILLFSNYLTYSAIDNLENRVSNLNNSVSRLADRVNNISSDVSMSLNEFSAENSWTKKAKAIGVNYKEKSNTVTVDVAVEFNELKNDETVYIVIQDTDNNVLEKVDVTKELNKSLKLYYTLDLAIDNDYDLSILGESADSKRSDEIGALYIKSNIQEICYVDGHSWESQYDENNNYKSSDIDIIINSAFQKEEYLSYYFKNRKIIDIQGEIYVDDLIFDTIDFMNDDNWVFFNMEAENDNKEEVAIMEVPAIEKGQLVLFEFNNKKSYFANLNGSYTFEKPVKASQKVQLFVIFKDNQGDEYRKLVYGVFDYEG